MSAPQVVGDLRTLVTRRAGLKRKVALLAADAGLQSALEQNGCTVLVDPASTDELQAFSPQVVVAFDGLLAEGAPGLVSLARAVPTGELVFSFANASAASALIHALLGTTPGPASTERDVRQWLREAGYVVKSRDVVVTPHVPSGLCVETETALRQLLEQLNPEAGADRLLFVAQRGVEATPPSREPGLTSVILSAGDDLPALEGTLRSLTGQLQRPLELVVVSSLPEVTLDEVARTAKGRAGLTLVLVPDAPTDALSRTNFGLTCARGQYVCCLEAGELLDRSHLSNLVTRLATGTEAWALSAPPVDLGLRFELRTWLLAGAVQRGRYVIDRERVGAFPLQFAEGLALGEAMFFCRLAALFAPSWVRDACSLDSPRVVPSTPAALREAMAARTLRTLGDLGDALQEPEAVQLGALLEDRLSTKNPTAGRLFGQARELVARVKHAALKAREDAKEELDRR